MIKFSVILSGGNEAPFVETFDTEIESINLFDALKVSLEFDEKLVRVVQDGAVEKIIDSYER